MLNRIRWYLFQKRWGYPHVDYMAELIMTRTVDFLPTILLGYLESYLKYGNIHEVAQKHNVTRERIRQALLKIDRKLNG